MSSGTGAHSHRISRLTKGAIGAGLCLCALISICSFSLKASAQPFSGQVHAQDVVAQLQTERGLEDLFLAGGIQSLHESEAAAWFNHEIVPLNKTTEAWINQEETVCFAEIPKQFCEGSHVKHLFKDKEWVEVKQESNPYSEGVITMIKNEGTCRWMMILATETESVWNVTFVFR